MSADRELRFTTVVESTGYKHRNDGRGGAVLLGARCPRCAEIVFPVIGLPVTCPLCGFIEPEASRPESAQGATNASDTPSNEG